MHTQNTLPTNHLPVGKLLNLHGRAAIVTEADSGIGIAIAQRLAEAGADILLCGSQPAALHQTSEQLQQTFGINAPVLHSELLEADTAYDILHTALHSLPHCDILVNNSSLFPAHPLRATQTNTWQQQVNVQLRTAYTLARELAKYLRQRGKKHGVILNNLALAALNDADNSTEYLALQHLLGDITRSMAVELGAWGIRCLALAPKRTLRPSVALTPEVAEMMAANPRTHQAFENYIKAILLARTEQDDAIATLALFAVSDMAKFMSGTLIPLEHSTHLLH